MDFPSSKLRYVECMLRYVECTHKNRPDEAILMSTHNIQLHDEIRQFPLIFFLLERSEEFRRDSKTSSNYPW